MNAANPQVIHRVMHEIKRRKLEVLRVVDLTPRMRRITVGGPQLAGFVSLGSDDHVKLFFPQTAEEQTALETLELGAGQKGNMPPMRDYTPRRIDLDTLELDIDFVLHGDGPAATWAAQATPGQYLHIGGPRGSMVVPDIFDSYLLIGDETALPAIARRLEELPAAAQAFVLIEVPSAANQIPLASAAQASVRWLHRDGTAPGYSTLLLEAARELTLPPGEGYVWVAAESAVAKAVREIMVSQHGTDKARIRAASYWKRGAVAVHESHED